MTTGGIIAIVVVVVLLFIVIIILCSCIKIVRQAEKFIVERLGAYKTTWDTGIHMLCPFIDRIAKKVSLKEQIYDFPPQPVITKDNVTMQIDTIVFFYVFDPKLFTYGVENPIAAIQALSSTTLRNIIGDMDLDDTLTGRDVINSKMRDILDQATDAWGIRIIRVEVKNILPPRDIQEAMEKQMRAEREKRERILNAEGVKTSTITIEEGKKQAVILKAEADKEAKIKAAEAEAESILKIKQAQAEGEILVREAEAKGIEMINNASPSKQVLTLRQFEAMAKVADGQATKIIVPSNLQDFTSLISIGKEVARDEKVTPVAKGKNEDDKFESGKLKDRDNEKNVGHDYIQHPQK